MQERTEEEKIAQAPLVVVLGGQEYEVKPLVIALARPWRAKYAAAFNHMGGKVNATTDDPEAFRAGINAMLVEMPDEVIDLFFAYAIDLDRKAIEAAATEVELEVAFKKLMEVAFPLAQSLVGVGLTKAPPENRAPRRGAGR